MTPNPTWLLSFAALCALLWIHPPGKLVSLLSLEHCLFLLLYFLLPIIPHSGVSFFHHCLLESHPSSKGREAVVDWLRAFWGQALSSCIILLNLQSSLWDAILVPLHRREGLEKLGSHLKSELKVEKLGFGFFKPGWSWHKSPGTVGHIYQVASQNCLLYELFPDRSCYKWSTLWISQGHCHLHSCSMLLFGDPCSGLHHARCPRGLWHLISDLSLGTNYLDLDVSHRLANGHSWGQLYRHCSHLICDAFIPHRSPMECRYCPQEQMKKLEKVQDCSVCKWKDLWRFQTYLPISYVKSMWMKWWVLCAGAGTKAFKLVESPATHLCK